VHIYSLIQWLSDLGSVDVKNANEIYIYKNLSKYTSCINHFYLIRGQFISIYMHIKAKNFNPLGCDLLL